MKPESTIAFFGSSLVSTYWNSTATYYRGILEVLHTLGYRITFYEPDILERQQNRDIMDPQYARVVVYQPTVPALAACLREALEADIIIKASGVGLFDEEIETFLLINKELRQQLFYWDVDAPATLARVQKDKEDYFRPLIPYFDHILTYGGGEKVKDMYSKFGAGKVTPIYNAYSPETHFPVDADPAYRVDLAFLGNRLPDREERVDEFFFKVAKALPSLRFLLGGSGWADKPMPANVTYLGHVSSNQHNVFNSSPMVVLNISRSSMAEYGYSPAIRVFEAAGAGACIITDAWMGVSYFFKPEEEILVVGNGEQLIEILQTLDKEKTREIGRAALERAKSSHTYSHRVKELLEIFDRNKNDLIS
ncbi:spore maturation protein CgeB [Algoriphagus sp. 4150]|uniref:CgeB family protein n=1 Tax=Algoriphagus sp. 4150 TaxID=2817756 RepID=UPI00285914B0|nr:glycosyltransferase [Algoriphagus sp. 4150]MDR7127853.1 spore maturation protein CgeB [Algoriphagus sp. 4150]